MDKNYEIMTITELKLGEDGARNVSNSVKDLVTACKGKVIDDDFWGKRKLSYPIKHENEAYYDVISFQMNSSDMTEFKKKLSFVDGIIRYLITVAEGDNK